MNLNKSQHCAIHHKDGAMLVLAGPGSGKTAVITQRTKNLIEEYNIPPSDILVITFTKAASNEMKERFYLLMGDRNARVSFGTFHAVFFTILKSAYNFSSENIISEDMRYRIMREILSGYMLDYKDENEFIGNLLGEIGMIKNSRIDINNFYSGVCGEDIFRKIYKEYEARLRKSRLIDFDDMLLYTYELFDQRKDILASWQKKFKYILIDEFQDINRTQYEIMKMLAYPQNNMFIVGDDDQSIYRFRGSRPEIMLNFEKDFPGAKRILLDVNYRCGKYIVETSKNLISHNKERFDKTITAASESCEPVSYITFENRRDENMYLIKDIKELVGNGRCFKEFAVLFRTNIQARSLIEQLMSYNIPFKIRDAVPNIYEHWIANDIFTYQRLAMGSHERKDFLQIMNRPKRYISRDSLRHECVEFAAWKKEFETQPWIAERIEKLECDLKLISQMSPYASVNYIRRGIGYDEFLKEYAKYKSINEEELSDMLDEIQESAAAYKTFAEWHEHIKKYTSEVKDHAKSHEEETDAVTLSTFHSSKGLEYRNVYLIDVNEGIVPYKKAILEKDIEEERRLFYVGMTRAKEKLSIYSVRSVNDKSTSVSRFVEESKNMVKD